MARWSLGGHSLSVVKFLFSTLVCIILFTPSSSALIVDASDDWNESFLVEGGRSLLVEELSTTWCENCAEIDPYLMEVADAHGSRIAMVTYHPTDGFDAFQPPASQHRIERLELTHPGIGSTPTFIVDGGQQRIGSDSWPDVQKDILSEEVKNLNPSELAFVISKNDNNSFTASIQSFNGKGNGDNISQLTFMLAKHSQLVPDEFDNPGGSHRDRVVYGVSECNLQNNSITYSSGMLNSNIDNNSCKNGFAVTFEPVDQFSILLIHEKVYQNLSSEEPSSSYGVVEFAFRNLENNQSWNNLLIILIGSTFIGFLWKYYENKNK